MFESLHQKKCETLHEQKGLLLDLDQLRFDGTGLLLAIAVRARKLFLIIPRWWGEAASAYPQNQNGFNGK